ncbi:uncharacterized protein [Miscanthus floridulus]|uniref:uncharacterized protein isoform X4 n=1 Tax=Miscanthus floridulus TaxID=154761 RepID=UPI003459EDD6
MGRIGDGGRWSVGDGRAQPSETLGIQPDSSSPPPPTTSRRCHSPSPTPSCRCHGLADLRRRYLEHRRDSPTRPGQSSSPPPSTCPRAALDLPVRRRRRPRLLELCPPSSQTMAKEEEKEGRAVAKDTRKRRSESNRKPDGSSNREDAKPKKKKVEYVVSLGHNSKMSDRHKGQLACLAALVTAKKTDLRATDNMQEILESDANNAGVYMEWSEEEETYFIHARSQSRQLLKFELLVIAGFGAVPEETEIKNPLLVFSEGFGNGGKWEDTKMLLFEVFSKPDANINCAKDYLYAFTRTSGKIYLRI